MNFNKDEFAVFESISEENLNTLLTCSGAQEKVCEENEELFTEDMRKKKCALILEGTAIAVGNDSREFTLGKGDIFGVSFFEPENVTYFDSVKAEKGLRVMVMNFEGMTVPCWFSCFFHACFIDNIEKARQRQEEFLTK